MPEVDEVVEEEPAPEVEEEPEEEEPVVDERQFFSIGCHSSNELRLLPGVLRQMADVCPNLYPIFQIVPFQHLYQLLEEGAVDAVIAFQEKGEKKEAGIYREVAKIPVVGVLSTSHPLAEKESLDRDDLRPQKLILMEPQRCPDSLNTVQHELTTGRAVSDLFLCGSADVCTTLAKAGFGIAVQPDFPSLRDPALAYIPIKDVEPLSYGAYYRSVTGKPLLKLFLQSCKDNFPVRPEEGREING